VDFADFVLATLPPPPGRVLEVGCGSEGGVTPALVEAGYDVLAIDPHAPQGAPYRRTTLEQLDEPGPFDAAVAGRVLHHVEPLPPAVDKLAGLAPLLVVDEFAWERFDEPTEEWYAAQHRLLVAAGRTPFGSPTVAEWRAKHPGLHPAERVVAELERRYRRLHLQDLPYLFHWLGGPATRRPLEESLIAADAIRPIGLRWSGATPARR
jgi:hypothetical protein